MPLGTLAVVATAACSDTGGARRVTPPPTLIAVQPVDFLGDVACLDAPGAMRRYVATIRDVTDDLLGEGGPDLEFELASSPPVSCHQTVTFGFVVPGHEYVAEVQGFDRTDISPFGGAGSGSPTMLDRDGQIVTPRWTTECGRATGSGDAQDAGDALDAGDTGDGGDVGDGGGAAEAGATDPLIKPARSVEFLTVPVRGCHDLVDHGSLGPTSILVDLSGALGTLSCGAEAGQVATFSARLFGSAAATEVACGESVPFEGLTAGVTYDFEVLAFENGSTTPSWSTRCFQTALAGVERKASCDLLSDRGSLTIDIEALLAQVGEVCGANGYPRARAVVSPTTPGPAIIEGPVACDTPIVLADLSAGSYEVVVTTVRADGSAGPSASCETTVLPGAAATANCVVAPAGG